MKHHKFKILFYLTVIIMTGTDLSAQVNSDSLFSAARRKAAMKDYSIALSAAKSALKADPARCDINVFIANLFAWQEDYDSAKYFIERAYMLDKASPELYDAWLNILLWNGEYDELLVIADTAKMNGYRNEYNILVKRLLALRSLGRFPEASDLFKYDRGRSFLDSALVKSLYYEIINLDRGNILTVFYSSDILPEMEPVVQHLAFADYSLRIKQHALLLRLNFASRFSKTGLQPEADYYHLLKNRGYIYLNYGYSFSDYLFPKHRAGIEYFFPLKHGFEASAGTRYLNFSGSHTGMATASLAKYIGPFLISVRPYYAFSRSGNSVSFTTDLRKYGKIPANYWNIELGYGNSPDERFIINQSEDYYHLESYRLKVSKNLVLAKTSELKLSLGYAYEELAKNDYTDRYVFEVILRFRLK